MYYPHHSSQTRPRCLSRHTPALAAVALACALLLSGCASFENTKGHLQLKAGKTEDGIDSLESATQYAPTDAGYKIDYLLTRDEKIRDVLRQADNFRADGKLPEAQKGYEAVLRMDRGNARARASLVALPQDARFAKLLGAGEAFLEQGKLELALDRANQVLEEHPQNRRASRLREAALDAQGNLDLEKSKGQAAKSVLERPVTLQYRDAPLGTVFESLARSVGLNILLDRDVKPGAKVSIFVKDIAVGDAIDFILMQNQLEKRTINANTLMVFPSSDAKKAEYEDLTIRSFQVTNVDLKYLSTMLKSMLKLREVAADERTGILVIRDTPERLRIAAKLIAVHDVPDPEIMLEVEILEVTSARRSNIGLDPPNSFSVATPGSGTAALTLDALRQLRSGDLLTSPLSATLNFKLQDTDAKLLASPRIRSRNREKAKIMIGDRVPTITNTVTPLTTGSSVVTGNVTYQDVGLKLEFEPQVYGNNEVGIKVSLEVSNIAAEYTDPQGGRAYQIGTRNANTNLRLKDGETQILGGLITDQDRNVASKIPGLGHLPVVGRIFGNNDGNEVRSEIVLAITPRIVRNLSTHSPEARNIFSGTLNVLRERPILAEPVSQVRPGGAAEAQRTPAAAPPTGAPGPVPSGQPQVIPPTPPGSVLFNPAASAPAGASQTPLAPSGGALLPAPPPMYVRPPTPAR
jgi:general secretion pathway protein D